MIDYIAKEVRMLLVNLLKDFEMLGEALNRGYEYPRIQLHSDQDNLQLLAEVPGLSEKDIEVSVSEDVVTIKGNKQKSKEPFATPQTNGEQMEKIKFRVLGSEIWSGDFARRIELPCEVDNKDIKATLKSGLLSLLMPIKEKDKEKIINVEGE